MQTSYRQGQILSSLHIAARSSININKSKRLRNINKTLFGQHPGGIQTSFRHHPDIIQTSSRQDADVIQKSFIYQCGGKIT
jgi:hypothetical protein